MGNFTALLFLLASCLAMGLSPTLRRDRSLFMAAQLTLLLHHAAALMNAFVTPLSTSWGDLYRFHNIGAGLYHEAGQPYGELLGILYHFGGVSFWLGETASILTYAFSLILFVEIGVRTGARNKMLECILLFGCLPSPVIHCSVTLREPYQSLGFLGCCLGLLLLREGRRLAAGWLLAGSMVLLWVMHQGLILFIFGILLFGFPWAFRARGHSGVLLLVFICLLPLGIPKVLSSIESDSPTAKAIREGNFVEYAANYRNLVDKARSDYGVKISTEGVPDFLLTTALVIVMYFVAPLPWQVSSPMDVYAMIEVALRLALIYGCVRRLQSERGELRQRLICIFVLASSLEFMWAVATTNWGTSLRHHVVVYGAYVLLGMPYYSDFTLDPLAAALKRRQLRRKQKNTVSQEMVHSSRGIDLYSLRAFFLSHLRWLVAITLISSALIIGKTRPRQAFNNVASLNSFLSSGSLLLSTSGKNQIMGVKAGSGASDLETWLAQPDLFRTLLERVRYRERLAKKLKKLRPELVAYANTVMVTPVYALDADARVSGRDKMVEGDYARIDSQVTRASYLRRASRLTIQVSAASPEGSRFLAETAISVLQETLVDIATRRIRNQKRAIQNYIALNQRRISKGELALAASSGLSPELLEKLERSELRLKRELSRLDGECSQLKSAIELQRKSTLVRHLAGQSPLSLEVAEAERERIQAENLYMPDSLALHLAAEHVDSVLRLGQQLESAQTAESLVLLNSNLRVKESQLQQVRQELRELTLRHPTAKAQSNLKERTKEIESWQAELLSWETKLIQARLEEAICRSEGVSTILQSPLTGVRSNAPLQRFLQPYQKMFSLLPFGPLLAIFSVLCLYLWRELRQIALRAEHYLDAPVLVELPRFKTGAKGDGRKNRTTSS